MKDTDALYSSTWDIDKLVHTVTFLPFTYPSGNTTMYTIPVNLRTGGFAAFDAYYRVGSTGPWKELGKEYFAYSTLTSIRMYIPYTGFTGQVRLFIYGDKVDY